MKDMVKEDAWLETVLEIPEDLENLSDLTQKQLELLYSKYQLMPTIRGEFYKAGFHELLEEDEIPVKFGIDVLSFMSMHKRIKPAALIGMLLKHFKEEDHPAMLCAMYLEQMVGSEYLDYDDVSDSLVVIAEIDPSVQRMLDQFQYPLPMIEPPRTVKHNRQTGYVSIKGSLILRDNHHEDDICLDHINRANAVPLALNQKTVTMIQNTWKHLDKKKSGETFEDFKKRKKAFLRYDLTSRDVIDALITQGNRIYLTHKYDKRGRIYCQGYHVSYQAADWNKAVVEFADKEPLNAE